MHPLIAKCFVQSTSSDERARSDALVDLSFILEMNKWKMSQDERESKYSHYVPQQLVQLEPTEEDLRGIVAFLESQFQTGKISAMEFFPLLRNASADVALLAVIHALKTPRADFGEDTLYQAFAALEKLLFWNNLPKKNIQSIVEEYQLKEVVTRLTSTIPLDSREKTAWMLSTLESIDEIDND